jgi:hypothetical protein
LPDIINDPLCSYSEAFLKKLDSSPLLDPQPLIRLQGKCPFNQDFIGGQGENPASVKFSNDWVLARINPPADMTGYPIFGFSNVAFLDPRIQYSKETYPLQDILILHALLVNAEEPGYILGFHGSKSYMGFRFGNLQRLGDLSV